MAAWSLRLLALVWLCALLVLCCWLSFILSIMSETLSQRFIQPTWRPPPTTRPFIIRTVRDLGNNEPLWLYKGNNIDRAPSTGDHPFLPKIIDDIKMDPNRRYARSVDSPSAKRASGRQTSSSNTRHSGPIHPGYNRRNTRDLLPIFRFPQPTLPTLREGFRKRFPIYASTKIA